MWRCGSEGGGEGACDISIEERGARVRIRTEESPLPVAPTPHSIAVLMEESEDELHYTGYVDSMSIGW